MLEVSHQQNQNGEGAFIHTLGISVIYLLPSLPSLLPTPNNPDSNVVYRHTARASRPRNKPGLSAPELREPSMELKPCDAVNSFARARVS